MVSKRRYLLALPMFWMMFGCSNSTEEGDYIYYPLPDTSAMVDSTETASSGDSEDTVEKLEELPIQKRSKFFDHIAYKKAKGGSHSSGTNKYKYWEEPGDTGIYFTYHLFNAKDARLGNKRMSDMAMEGLEVVVYKLTGKPGFYSDTNEVLIEVYSHLKDPDLGKLDIVGKHLDEIKADFHAPAMIEDNSYAYELGDGYTLFVRNDPITAFRLVRLNDKLSKQAFDEAFSR